MFRMHVFKNCKIHHITSLFWSFSINVNPRSEHPESGICGDFFCVRSICKKQFTSPEQLTWIACYMEGDGPYGALIFLERVVKRSENGREPCLSFLEEDSFFLFVHFCTGVAGDWMPWKNAWHLSKLHFADSLCVLLPSGHRRSEHPGGAPQRGGPSAAPAASGAGARPRLVWQPQQTDMVAEVRWQVEQLRLGELRVF